MCVGNQIQLTTRGRISIFIYGGTLAVRFEEPRPVVFVGVAQVLVLNDDHVAVADFFEGAEAQGGDTELNHNHAAATATKKKKGRTGGREEGKKGKGFMTALNNTQLLKKKFTSCEPVAVNLQGGVFTRNIPLRPSSNDLQIFKRTE